MTITITEEMINQIRNDGYLSIQFSNGYQICGFSAEFMGKLEFDSTKGGDEK